MNGLSLKRRRDIRRQRWQFIAVLVTIVLGVMMFSASYDAYENLTASYNGTYDRLAFADATVTGGDDSLADALLDLDGVVVVDQRKQADVPLKVGDTVLVGRVVSIPEGVEPPVNRLDVIAGAYPAQGADADALIETHMASHFDLLPGDTVSVLTVTGWQDVTLAGEAVSPEYLWPARSSQQFFEPAGSFGVLFVSENILDAVDPVQVVPQCLVLYKDDADTAELDGAVRAAALANGASGVTLKADQASNKALNLDVTGFQQMTIFFPAMFLLAAGLAAYTLLTRVVYSQRSIIGTLRANGFGQKQILRHYLSYGLWLGLTGSVIGVALGVPAGWAMTAAYTAELGIPDTIRELHWITPVIGILFGLVTGVFSAWIPARVAVRLTPAEAIRGDSVEIRGHRSLIERLIPPLAHASVQTRMVLRGIGRSKRRSFSVVLAIVLAMTLVFTSWGMVDTVKILLTRHFEEITTYDADVVTAVPVDAGMVETIADVWGVDHAEAVVALEASLIGSDGTYSTTLFAYEPGTKAHGFLTESGEGPTDGVIVGSSVLEETGVAVGDTVRISLPTLNAAFDLTVEDAVTEPMGSPVYVSREVLEDALATSGVAGWESAIEQPGVSVVEVILESYVSRETALENLRDLDVVVSVSDAQAIYTLVRDYMGLFYLLVGMMLVFGGILAVALIFNVISVNLAERIGELATMRANGVSQRRIGTYVLAENMILTAIGVVPGAAIAYGAASWLMSTYTSDMLSFDLETYPSSIILSALLMFAVTAVSLWPGMRAVRRLDIASEVRERSQ